MKTIANPFWKVGLQKLTTAEDFVGDFLRLDTTNDPLTAGLEINAATNVESVLTLQTTDDGTGHFVEYQTSLGTTRAFMSENFRLTFDNQLTPNRKVEMGAVNASLSTGCNWIVRAAELNRDMNGTFSPNAAAGAEGSAGLQISGADRETNLSSNVLTMILAYNKNLQTFYIWPRNFGTYATPRPLEFRPPGNVGSPVMTLTTDPSVLIEPLTATDIALEVRAKLGQTSDVLQVQDSIGVALTGIHGDGRIFHDGPGFVASAPSLRPDALAIGQYTTSAVTARAGIVILETAPVADSGSIYMGMNMFVDTRSNVNFTNSVQGGLIGGRYQSNHRGTGTVTKAVGASGKIGILAAGTITDGIGVQAEGFNLGNTGTISNYYGFYSQTATTTGASLVNAYGLYIEDVVNGATSNHSIVTNAGDIVFNEGGDANSDVRMESDIDTNMFFLDSSTNQINIGKLQINSAFTFPTVDGAQYEFLQTNGAGVVTWEDTSALRMVVTTKTADYTATVDDTVILVDATSGVVTITLPTAVGNSGKQFFIKKIDAGGNRVIIDADGSETIDGALTQEILFTNTDVPLVSDGSNWFIL